MPDINYAAALPVLRKGRERIQRGWIQGGGARSRDDKPVRADSPWAVQWSLSGATKMPKMRHARDVLYKILGCPLTAWNDAPGRTQAEVLALFDRAIAECEEKTR